MESDLDFSYDAQSQINVGLIDDFDNINLLEHNKNDDLENMEEPERIHDMVKGIPYIGMLFAAEDKAYSFYNAFAKSRGFSVRKSTVIKGNDGETIKRLYVCSQEGHKSLNDKRQIGRYVKRLRCERGGCEAKMKINICDEGGYIVKSFNDEHNHTLISTPSKIGNMRSHREKPNLALVEQIHNSGCGPSGISKILNNIGGSNLTNITGQQIIDLLRIKRKSNIGHECMSMIQQFVQSQAADYQFYYAVEVDEENICRSIFWADGRARTSYLQFSDVLVFDVTYKTNKFMLPFAPFTGVNHHRQSTLFGCALLADEKEETFEWLFQNWLKCMWGKAPNAIITDQDPAIRNAIKKVFPNTHHRYCIWHIGLHEDEHLRSLRYSYGTDFNEDYTNWSRRRQTIEEAENCWLILNNKYKRNFQDLTFEKEDLMPEKKESELKAWKWLQSMYDQRHHWVEAYLQNTFFAGMLSSQRSESINAFFDGFVNSMTPLYQFVGQYNNALASRRAKEEQEDTWHLRTVPDTKHMHELEAHAAEVYTRNIFRIFQEEFKSVLFCRHDNELIEGPIISYNVTFKIKGKTSTRYVKCNMEDHTFLCSCAKFETEGLICKHILHIMMQKYDMEKIPECYILSRWTLKGRHSTTHGISSSRDIRNDGNGGFDITPLETWCFHALVNKFIEKVSQDRRFYNIAIKLVDNFWKECDKISTTNTNPVNAPSSQVGSSDAISAHITIKDPKKVSRRGRPPKASRIPSGIHVSQARAQSTSRTCSTCHEKGHDMRTCAKNKVHDMRTCSTCHEKVHDMRTCSKNMVLQSKYLWDYCFVFAKKDLLSVA